jgi:hypothetical protein
MTAQFGNIPEQEYPCGAGVTLKLAVEEPRDRGVLSGREDRAPHSAKGICTAPLSQLAKNRHSTQNSSMSANAVFDN